MQYMSEDDAAYSALLAQLLSDNAPTRNARVHSWIEHQYDFVLSELPFPSSRPPSPSPSSSLGAHRACSIDRPDSPLLPRISSDRTSSPCPSYDALFFPPYQASKDNDFEEQERVRALRFIVQEMAHWKSTAAHPHPHDKPLPAPPPSPASSVTSSRAMRSRSSSTRMSRLPSFTSTLSSDQSQPQELPPPLPVSVIVHGEYQHDLIVRHERDGYLHKRDDSFPRSLASSKDQDAQYLCPAQDDKDSFQPSPTLSNFSCTYSRETSTPYTSSPASPTSVVFSSSPCSPENIALPASPIDEDKPFFTTVHERTPSSRTSQSLSSVTVFPPKTSVFPASPSLHDFPLVNSDADGAPQNLRAPRLASHSQSRWSVATTASLAPSTAEPKRSDLLDPRTPPKDKKDKGLKTPVKKRTRFISLISRFSPGRVDPSSTTSSSQTRDDVEYDSANDSDIEDRGKIKHTKTLSKKSSLASLRPSFSLSRPSFSSQRPPMPPSVEEVPPLPTSPTLTSLPTEASTSSEGISSFLKASLSRIPSRANLLNSLPPIPQSASTATFQSSSQLSISDATRSSVSDSRVSLVCPTTTPNGSRISLLPAPSKRTSLASAAGVGPVVVAKSVPANQATRSKSIFRLTAKPKSLKMPAAPGTKETATPSRLPVTGNTSLPSPTTRSRIPPPTKFNPPAKLATVMAQSRQVPALASPGPISPTSKLPSRVPPKVPRPIAIIEKPVTESLPSPPASSRLPMPASAKVAARVGTVKGFWKRP
ncbi:hypothetical protein OG21DRAFT_1507306 [Imleria badia]|nr:hypothetical protein OG21DRAFT_1507306 [Imleria badia]